MQDRPLDRAKQFLPFDALTGFREALRLKEKELEEKKILLEDKEKLLNDKIIKIKKGTMVDIKYYNEFEYIETIGKVKNIDLVNKNIILLDTIIEFDNIDNVDIIN